MTPEPKVIEHRVGDRSMLIETGRVAEQANGAVLMRMGDTVVLCTATMSKEPRPGIDFLPLTCDYEEKIYAAGRIPGSFFRREGRPGEQGILNSRLIDRPVRPLFEKDLRLDVQVVATVLSVDHDADPATLAINGASAALSISDIPWKGPIGAVRMGLIDGELVVNPGVSKMPESQLDLIVAGTADAIIMVEAGAKEVTEDVMLKALQQAHDEIKRICATISEYARALGKPKKNVGHVEPDEALAAAIDKVASEKVSSVLGTPDKAARENALDDIKADVRAALAEKYPEREAEIGGFFEKTVKRVVRDTIIDQNQRPDGRKTDEIRPIWSQVGGAAPGPMARRSSPAARPRRSRLPPSVPLAMPRRSTGSASRPASATCTTTTSRRSRWARRARCVAPAAARSAMVPWLSAPSPMSCRVRTSTPT